MCINRTSVTWPWSQVVMVALALSISACMDQVEPLIEERLQIPEPLAPTEDGALRSEGLLWVAPTPLVFLGETPPGEDGQVESSFGLRNTGDVAVNVVRLTTIGNPAYATTPYTQSRMAEYSSLAPNSERGLALRYDSNLDDGSPAWLVVETDSSVSPDLFVPLRSGIDALNEVCPNVDGLHAGSSSLVEQCGRNQPVVQAASLPILVEQGTDTLVRLRNEARQGDYVAILQNVWIEGPDVELVTLTTDYSWSSTTAVVFPYPMVQGRERAIATIRAIGPDPVGWLVVDYTVNGVPYERSFPIQAGRPLMP